MLAEAHECRSHILRMLHDGIPTRQSRDLYLVAALLSGINAYACLDLSHPDAAMTEAEAGQVCATFAGHNGLRAWMYGTQSLIARFRGRYPQALDLARQGFRYAATGTALNRLRCGEAQSLACLGNRVAACHALDLADEALAHVYLGTARVTLGDLDGVLEAIRPVLDIPPRRRISWQRKRLARLGAMLDEHRFQRSPLATALKEEIFAFSC
jgi:hypothetical protein